MTQLQQVAFLCLLFPKGFITLPHFSSSGFLFRLFVFTFLLLSSSSSPLFSHTFFHLNSSFLSSLLPPLFPPFASSSSPPPSLPVFPSCLPYLSPLSILFHPSVLSSSLVSSLPSPLFNSTCPLACLLLFLITPSILPPFSFPIFLLYPLPTSFLFLSLLSSPPLFFFLLHFFTSSRTYFAVLSSSFLACISSHLPSVFAYSLVSSFSSSYSQPLFPCLPPPLHISPFLTSSPLHPPYFLYLISFLFPFLFHPSSYTLQPCLHPLFPALFPSLHSPCSLASLLPLFITPSFYLPLSSSPVLSS